MWLFDITKDTITSLIYTLAGWECPPSIALLITRILLWGILFVSLALLYRKHCLLPRKAKNTYIRNHIDSGYQEYLTRKSQKYYITARVQNIPPNHYPDILDSLKSVSTENMIDKYLNDIFIEDNADSPLYCVLGGSGMGKTSFLINVLKRYVMKYAMDMRPYDIELVNLANENFREKVVRIREPKNTILLLDALDENPQAVSDYSTFIRELEEIIEPFHLVVVTCRTQFFADEEHELKQSKLRSNGKSKAFYAYTRHYISPFSNSDVEKYLKKKYRFNILKRCYARKIVKQCASFTHRPLLLSYIDTLLNAREKYDNILDVYETLIDKWLDRDINNRENQSALKEKFLRLLQESAVKMYYNFPNAGYFLNSHEIDNLLNENGLSEIKNLYKGRSLLNRDSLGLWKFSHKSFLEYFLAKEYFINKNFKIDFAGLEVAQALFHELCARELNRAISDETVYVGRSHSLLPNVDTLELVYGSNFDIRNLEAFKNITILELDARMLDKVRDDINRTNITYLKINNYNNRISLYWIIDCANIKYLSVNGALCSKSLIKELTRRNISLMNNDELITYEILGNSSEIPIDFHSAIHVSGRLNYMLSPLSMFLDKNS